MSTPTHLPWVLGNPTKILELKIQYLDLDDDVFLIFEVFLGLDRKRGGSGGTELEFLKSLWGLGTEEE